MMLTCFLLFYSRTSPAGPHLLMPCRNLFITLHIQHMTFTPCSSLARKQREKKKPAHSGTVKPAHFTIQQGQQLPVPAAGGPSAPSTEQTPRQEPRCQQQALHHAHRHEAAALGWRWSTVIDARRLPRRLLGSSASYF